MAQESKKQSKVKKNKRLNWKLIIVLILIIATITTIVIIQNNKNKEDKENNNNNTNLENQEYNMGLIDMNNTENARISEGVKENISKNVAKNRTVEGIEITDIKLLAENGISIFTATVTNNTGKDFEETIATIRFTNKDGSEYANLEVIIPKVKNAQTNMINAGTTADITNAYDFTITLQK